MANTRHTRVELNGAQRWRTEATIGAHVLVSDAPESSGGKDLAPDPEEMLLASYGSCTAMTVQMYAQRKGWPVENVIVDLELTPKSAGQPDRIRRTITFVGPLDAEQRERLLQIANKCPVHRLLSGATELITQAAETVP